MFEDKDEGYWPYKPWTEQEREAPEVEAPAPFVPPDDPKPHALACKRVPARKVWRLLPAKYYESLEQNQKLLSCCRHPENHDIEAWYSSEEDRAKRIPDIYILYCTCGRRHRRFCVGMGDVRPFWEVR
jgi:hypothetical protein